MDRDIVVGAGVGGLCAAIALRAKGRHVLVVEARKSAGGLAGGFTVEGKTHDGGPYVLLDRPGLEWAFAKLGIDLLDHAEPIALEEVYTTHHPQGPSLTVYRDLDRTADGLEREFRGAGDRYRAFIRNMSAIYENLAPLQRGPHPGAQGLLRRGLFREAAFLLQGLRTHLRGSGLPEPVQDMLGIWTHIAGQPLGEAPAPLAFVPAIVHGHGAFTIRGGLRRVPEALYKVAVDRGVDFRFGAPVTRIVRTGRRVLGVEAAGERFSAARVFCNAPGVGAYAALLDPPDARIAAEVKALPLQSPGVAAYIHANVDASVPFLQFWLPAGEPCRLLLHPGAVDPERAGTLRLISPTAHAWAESVGPVGQRAFLDRILAEAPWRVGVTDARVVASKIPAEWGRAFFLWRDSINPTMTASYMRHGRIAHVSPVADNLFLCGSATHPGQWVSFCAISGVLAADCAG